METTEQPKTAPAAPSPEQMQKAIAAIKALTEDKYTKALMPYIQKLNFLDNQLDREHATAQALIAKEMVISDDFEEHLVDTRQRLLAALEEFDVARKALA